MITRQIINNPLGEYGHLYLEKKNSQGAVHLIPDKQTLEFYPTGYTKYSAYNAAPRQQCLEKLYKLAVTMDTEEGLFPFQGSAHNVVLKPVNDIDEDKYAIRVILTGLGRMEAFQDVDLGWVPKRISRALRPGIRLIRNGRILKIRKDWHDKYYTCKVIFSYGDTDTLLVHDQDMPSRFTDIMEEISS